MSQPATNLIIVYGTLRSDGWNHGLMHAHLGEVEFLGDVHLPFTMFYLGFGGVPGVDIYTPGTMQAQLWSMNEPEAVLRRLDMLEGYNAGNPEASMYRREVVPVEFGGAETSAYIYHYNRQRNSQAEVITLWKPR